MAQQGEGEGLQGVALVGLPLPQPLGHQVVQVGAHEALHAPVAQRSGHTAQHLQGGGPARLTSRGLHVDSHTDDMR